MKKNVFCLACFLLSTFIICSFSFRDDGLENLIKNIENYSSEYASEKVHLQLDKPYYSIGDDLWFKAYVVNSKKNELSNLSHVLYIDITDDHDSLRKTMVMPLANGLCFGSLKLTDSLVDEGKYHIKAYTKWMLNFDQDFILKKDIVIGDANTRSAIVTESRFNQTEKQNAEVKFINLSDSTPVAFTAASYSVISNDREISAGRLTTDEKGKITVAIPRTVNNSDNATLRTAVLKKDGQTIYKDIPIIFPVSQIDLQFFPESGVLVNGIRSKIAFKAVGADGLGVAVEGYIADENNKQLVDFKAAHAGMGIVALTPQQGAQYTAVITNPVVTKNTFKIPIAQPNGYVLSLNHLNNDSLSIRVSTAPTQVSNETLTLVGLQNGTVKFVTKINMNKPVISSIIAKQKFATGITQFTLFSPAYKPLAERLIFLNNRADAIAIKLNAEKPRYGKREKVEMELDAKGKDTAPIAGSFSVAVTSESKVRINEDQETSIFSDFLLSSDLKGYIENPNYYFNHIDATKIQHLDYLMLSQGWRRFSWKDILENRNPELKFQAEKSLALTGLIANLQKKPVPNGKVEIFANTAEGLIATTANADEKGLFIINDLFFSGNATFTAKGTNTEKKKNVNIYFDKPAKLRADNSKKQPADFLNNGVFNYLKNTKVRLDELEKNEGYSRGIVLKDIEIKASYVEKNVVKGSKKLGNSVPDIVITKDKLKNYTNLVQAFYGLPGIEVLGNGVTDGVIALTGMSSITGGKTIMKVILDGGEIDPDMLKDIAPSSIEGIEILKRGSAAIYNALGVIVITSKSGSDTYYSKYALNSYTLQGYHVSRDFYAPVYDRKAEQRNSPDLRSTIFWKPDLVTNSEGKAVFSYYTADESGRYRITIEGLDINGHLARHVSFITVN